MVNVSNQWKIDLAWDLTHLQEFSHLIDLFATTTVPIIATTDQVPPLFWQRFLTLTALTSESWNLNKLCAFLLSNYFWNISINCLRQFLVLVCDLIHTLFGWSSTISYPSENHFCELFKQFHYDIRNCLHFLCIWWPLKENPDGMKVIAAPIQGQKSRKNSLEMRKEGILLRRTIISLWMISHSSSCVQVSCGHSWSTWKIL